MSKYYNLAQKDTVPPEIDNKEVIPLKSEFVMYPDDDGEYESQDTILTSQEAIELLKKNKLCYTSADNKVTFIQRILST